MSTSLVLSCSMYRGWCLDQTISTRIIWNPMKKFVRGLLTISNKLLKWLKRPDQAVEELKQSLRSCISDNSRLLRRVIALTLGQLITCINRLMDEVQRLLRNRIWDISILLQLTQKMPISRSKQCLSKMKSNLVLSHMTPASILITNNEKYCEDYGEWASEWIRKVTYESSLKIVPRMKEPVGESSFRAQVLFAARPRKLTQTTCRSIYALLALYTLVLSMFITCLSYRRSRKGWLKWSD